MEQSQIEPAKERTSKQADLISTSTRMKIVYLGLIAITFLIILLNVFDKRHYFDDADGYGYYELAQLLLRGELSGDHQVQKWPPGYPALLIGMNFFTNDYFLAAKILVVIFGTLYVFTSMLLAREIVRNDIITLFFGINILLKLAIWSTLTLITDMPFAVCFHLTIFFLLKGLRSSALEEHSLKENIKRLFRKPGRYFIYAGMAGGASCLLRWTGMIILIIGLMMFFIAPVFTKNSIADKIRAIFRVFLHPGLWLYLAVFFMIWSFWLIPNWIMFGSPFHSIIYREPLLWGPVYIPYDIDHTQFSNLIEIILYDPGLFLRNYLVVLGRHVMFFIYEIFISERLFSDFGTVGALIFFMLNLMVAIFGAYSYLKKNQPDEKEKDEEQKSIIWMNTLSLLVMICAFIGAVSISVALRRFVFPVSPFGFLFFLLGAQALWNEFSPPILAKLEAKLSTSKSSTVSNPIVQKKALITILLLSITIANTFGGLFHVGNEMRQKRHDAIELEIAGNVLKQYTNSTKITFARNNYWYYYNASVIRMNSTPVFPSNEGELANVTNDFLVFAEGWDLAHFPGMDFLFDPEDPRIPENYQLLYLKTHPCMVYELSGGYSQRVESERTIVIYRVHH